jgi:hypothetical protein
MMYLAALWAVLCFLVCGFLSIMVLGADPLAKDWKVGLQGFGFWLLLTFGGIGFLKLLQFVF